MLRKMCYVSRWIMSTCWMQQCVLWQGPYVQSWRTIRQRMVCWFLRFWKGSCHQVRKRRGPFFLYRHSSVILEHACLKIGIWLKSLPQNFKNKISEIKNYFCIITYRCPVGYHPTFQTNPRTPKINWVMRIQQNVQVTSKPVNLVLQVDDGRGN